MSEEKSNQSYASWQERIAKLSIRYFFYLVFVPLFVLIVLWDIFTTYIGICVLLDLEIKSSMSGNASGWANDIALISTALMLITLCFTFYIWGKENIKSDFIHFWLRIIWILIFLYDVYASYHGNKRLIFGEDSEDRDTYGNIVIWMSAFIVSSSVVILAWMLKDRAFGRQEAA